MWMSRLIDHVLLHYTQHVGKCWVRVKMVKSEPSRCGVNSLRVRSDRQQFCLLFAVVPGSER